MAMQPRPSTVTVYTENGTMTAMKCSMPLCGKLLYISFEEISCDGRKVVHYLQQRNGRTDVVEGIKSDDVFLLSRKTGFTISYLEYVTSLLLWMGGWYLEAGSPMGCENPVLYIACRTDELFKSILHSVFLLKDVSSPKRLFQHTRWPEVCKSRE